MQISTVFDGLKSLSRRRTEPIPWWASAVVLGMSGTSSALIAGGAVALLLFGLLGSFGLDYGGREWASLGLYCAVAVACAVPTVWFARAAWSNTPGKDHRRLLVTTALVALAFSGALVGVSLLPFFGPG